MSNENKKHNGWTNYATWRVNLEIFDRYDIDDHGPLTSCALKDYAEMLIENEGTGSGLAFDYAMAFLDDVNWQEIADKINDIA